MVFTPSKSNPILKPNEKNSWEAAKVYNPGAIYYNDKYYLFYRAVGFGRDWQSVIGYAVSKDGMKFKRFSKPLLYPKVKSEIRGLEDPRITKIADKFYMAFTAYDGITPRLNIATSKNLVDWQRTGNALSDWQFEKAGGKYIKWRDGKPVLFPQPNEWSKSGGIFPEKIKEEYLMLFGEYHLWFAKSRDGKKWKADNKPFLSARQGNYFDNIYVEMGPPPIRTEKGWLVLYHGIDKKASYQLGYLLLDLKNPRKILYRSRQPIFSPQKHREMRGIIDILPGGLKKMELMTTSKLNAFLKETEKKRFMPRIIFCCGAVVISDKIKIYYGINDTYIGTATAKLKDILNSK
jgi:beta-1,2-mannobiose phosphorylase / 1,2-beta-oligomannan phosphorylase